MKNTQTPKIKKFVLNENDGNLELENSSFVLRDLMNLNLFDSKFGLDLCENKKEMEEDREISNDSIQLDISNDESNNLNKENILS